MRRLFHWFAGGFGILIAVTPLLAHHPISAKFDPAKPMTLSGLVTKVDWANPHVHIFMDVRNGNQITSWAIELESPVDLERSGWRRDSLEPGAPITVQGIAARDGSQQAWGNSIVMTDGGERLFELTAAARPTARRDQPAPPTPRRADGRPRLGPTPGETGYWGNPSSTVLMESGANVAMDEWGLLQNIADVDKVAPFQQWARDLYEYRQRNFLKDDPQYLYCMPPGGPRQFQLPYGTQFVEDLERERIIVLVANINSNWRFIYLDGRPQVGALRGDADNPLFYGRSAAHWEGDTLVVDTKGFNERFWFSNGGLPHTEQLHLIERFTRTDFNTLNYEVTITDPGAYTRPWSASWTLDWIAGEELPPYYCQDNRP